ncbi:ATP-binding protein [Streptomyces sp. P9-2B-2]|uniref:ATP-binding protein n=1 Tax=Streptomyces sp. P9-2B-2 TaxID=3057114 RepID=UPI0025B56E3D|nr:ATP-binding protein [Streptomyces sp. P9-2B-2]WJY40714.1 ATP-binding protein [Streptomyces sp. P9-2B-2]
MDPNTHRGPEEYGEPGSPAVPPAPAFGGAQSGSAERARVVRLVSGPYLVTVNPVDGSEIEPCPPGERPAAPGRLDAEERAAAALAAAPPLPPGTAAPETALEERTEDTERLVRLLSRGRSVRVTGPSGSGRTRLLDAVATACADLAPDGVIRLSGYHRTSADLLYALFAAVYRAPQHRPDRPEMLRMVAEIGAIVVLDDLEFGGAALDELLDATPECAFLIAATPDVAAPSAASHLEEVFLGGIGRGGCGRLLERAVDRPLTDDEEAWAADLWFESEGLPLRFVQAAALLRQHDRAQAGPGALDDGYGLFPGDGADEPAAEPAETPEAVLPSLGEAAAPAPLLASRLTEAARETLRFAVALGGELPHQAHLPALTQDTHADAALGELLACGLLTPAGGHYRLAATVQDQLTAAGYADGAAARAHTVAQHYAWWAGHPSVSPERAAAESDVALAAMGVLTGSRESGHASAAVLLARTAAPAFAAALHWSAWERSLRHGQEAARLAGEVAEEAYFHHELGVLALCTGSLDRARAELEASIGLRGVLSDRNGAVAGRRALALVTDRTRADSAAAATTALPTAAAPRGTSKAPGTPFDTASTALSGSTGSTAKLHKPRAERAAAATLVARNAAATAGTTTDVPAVTSSGDGASKGVRRVFGGARRNAVAAGAGALLAAVLGTVVTIGATGGDDPHNDKVNTEQTTDDGESTDLPAEQPATDTGRPPTGPGTSRPGTAGQSDRPSPSATSPSASGSPSDPATGSPDPTADPTRPTERPTTPTGRPTRPTHPPTDEPSDPTPSDEPTEPSPSGTTPTEPTGKPTSGSPSQSASGPSASGASGTAPSGTAPSGGTPSDGTATSSGTASAPAA